MKNGKYLKLVDTANNKIKLPKRYPKVIKTIMDFYQKNFYLVF
jgi:hypothetical protein